LKVTLKAHEKRFRDGTAPAVLYWRGMRLAVCVGAWPALSCSQERSLRT